jgi:ElaB/YqjD/DUF883 family membrane-anchored ribosome-binding protein
MFDMHAAYKKLANREALSSDEAQALLKELEHFRLTAAYLASCHAATAESLPASASKSSRKRHASICKVAVDALKDGRVTWPVTGGDGEKQVQAAAGRCEKWLKERGHVE